MTISDQKSLAPVFHIESQFALQIDRAFGETIRKHACTQPHRTQV